MAQMILNVYHGSHSKFTVFDMSKIGTGENTHSEGIGICLTSEMKYATRSALTAAKNNNVHGRHNYVYEVRVIVDDANFWDADLAYKQLNDGIRSKINIIKDIFKETEYRKTVKCLNGDEKEIIIPTNCNGNTFNINSNSYFTYNLLLNTLGKWETYYLLQDIGIDLVKLQSHKFVAINPGILCPQIRHYLDWYSNPLSEPFIIANNNANP